MVVIALSYSVFADQDLQTRMASLIFRTVSQVRSWPSLLPGPLVLGKRLILATCTNLPILYYACPYQGINEGSISLPSLRLPTKVPQDVACPVTQWNYSTECWSIGWSYGTGCSRSTERVRRGKSQSWPASNRTWRSGCRLLWAQRMAHLTS